MMGDAYDDYVPLLEQFIQRKMSATEFQTAYMKLFKTESRQLDEAVFAVLDTLFGDVDAFCADPGLRNELEAQNPGFYLDEERLRQRVAHAHEQLETARATSAQPKDDPRPSKPTPPR